MISCPSCGRDNPDGFRFCGFCSAPLEAPTDAQARKTVTVLFIDLTGFTSMSERLDAESVRALVGRYAEAMRGVAESHGGTVEKFIGDAVMAVFGVPTAHEDDALRAVRAAWDMFAALERINESVRTEHGFALAAHAGINTGEVVVGTSAEERLATGDAVNVAARLQSAAGAGEILIGEPTYQLVRPAVTVEPARALELKGKAEVVAAYRVTAVDPAAPAFERRLDQPLVGREAELRAVLDAFDAAVAERRCRVVTIVGPPGLGKSKLTAEAVGRIGETARVLVGRCLPYGDGITFWPVAEAVRGAAGITEEDSAGEAAAKIASLITGEDAEVVRSRLAAALGLGGEAGSLRETYWAVRRLLESLAQDLPVTFVVEDIHWAEPALLDLLEYLAEFTADAPVLVLCTARPELREGRPDWGRDATTITLQPLGEAESARLVENLLGSAGVPEAVIDRVARSAEGNPLFAEELLRKLRDDQLLVRANGGWEVRGSLDELEIPGTISALLAARIDGLPEGERATVQRGAVVGRVFYWRAVEALAPEPERPEVGANLRTLVRKEVIHPERDEVFVGEEAFAFGHILVRDAAYDSTPKGVRADLHELFASWLEHAAGDRVQEYEEIIGYHLAEAARYRRELSPGDPRTASVAERAGAKLLAAGERAGAHGDTGAAMSLLRRAAELLPAADPRRLRALLALGAVRFEAGMLEDATAVLQEARELAAALGDTVAENLALLRRLYILAHGEPDPDPTLTFDQAARAAEALQGSDDPVAAIEATATLGIFEFFAGETASAVANLRRAVDRSRARGEPDRFASRWLIVAAAYGVTPVREALEIIRDLEADVAEGSAAQEPVLRLRGALASRLARYEEARGYLRRAQAIADELGLVIVQGAARRSLAEAAEWAGDLEEAERELREGVALFERIRDYSHATSLASRLGGVLAQRGALEEARRFVDLGRAWLTFGDVDAEAEWWMAEIRLALAQGDAEAGLRHADEAITRLRTKDYLSALAEVILLRALVLEMAGRTGEAADAAREGLEVARRKEDLRLVGLAEAILERLGA